MLRLITDFDGPIMDVSERYYQVYQYCLTKIKQQNQLVNLLSKSQFWQLKRAQIPEKEIGLISGLNKEQAQRFSALRRQTVHTLPYLIYDQPVPNAIAILEKIQSLNLDLVVMTMRRVRELDYALKSHNLGRFFSPSQRYCLSNDYLKTTDVQDKPRLMERALKELPAIENVWMVGDTEADIAAAKAYNIPFVGVLSGIRDRQQLEQYQPNFIVNNLGEALDLILAIVTEK